MSSYQLHHPVSISSLLPSPRPPLRGGLPAASPLLGGLTVGVLSPPPPTPPPPGGGVGVRVRGLSRRGRRAPRCWPTASMYWRRGASCSEPAAGHTSTAQSVIITPPAPPPPAPWSIPPPPSSPPPPLLPPWTAVAGACSSAPSQLACKSIFCVQGSRATRPNCSRWPKNPATSWTCSTWLADWKPADTAVNMSLIIGVACRHDTGQMRRRIHACHTRRRIHACRHDTGDSQAGKHPSRPSQARGGMRPPSWKAPEKAWPVCV